MNGVRTGADGYSARVDIGRAQSRIKGAAVIDGIAEGG